MSKAQKKLLKEYERQLKAEPDNLVVRLKLAAVLIELARYEEAVAIYRSVAIAYHQQGRLAQAIAVCRSILEIEPAHRETQELLATLDALRAARDAAAPPADPPPPAPLPATILATPSAAPSEPPPPAPRAAPAMARPQFFAPPATPISPVSSVTPLPKNVSLVEPTPPVVDVPPPPRRSPSELTPESRSDPFRASTPGSSNRLPLSAPIAEEVPGSPAVTIPGLPRPKLPIPTSGRIATPPPLPPHEDEEEEGLTIPAYSPKLAAPPPVPPSPGPHEAETRVVDPPHAAASEEEPTRIQNGGPGSPEPPTNPGPPPPLWSDAITTPVTPSPSLPGELTPYARRDRLLDVGPWPDTDPSTHAPPEETAPRVEPTVASRPSARRPERDTDPHDTSPYERIAPAASPAAPRGEEHDHDADHELTLAQAFDRPFAVAVENLAPDGTTIEPPLEIFHRLPPDALRELQRRMIIRRVGAGTVIVREGDPGEACYVVHTGCVRVLKRDPARPKSEQIEVARLAGGSLFGEFALLADRRRHATVQAIEATELYEIPRRLLRELAASYPGVGPALERLYRERLLSTLLATAPFFRPLPEEERVRLMTRFQPRRVEAGAIVIREGDRAGGLYLVVLGTVEITKKVEGQRAVLLAALGEGSYFGEMSLLRGTPAYATVTAAGPVELAQLPPREFYAILTEHPVLWEELRREAERREQANQTILSGDTNCV